ncbi:hypothetical protein MHBO_001408 [Bonamia ostreae]|uniref:Uncharacterized protein n=1 Tax=Bonamia ostreae TaxID=126728 RepID=A0ABV2AIU6_9EUKA
MRKTKDSNNCRNCEQKIIRVLTNSGFSDKTVDLFFSNKNIQRNWSDCKNFVKKIYSKRIPFSKNKCVVKVKCGNTVIEEVHSFHISTSSASFRKMKVKNQVFNELCVFHQNGIRIYLRSLQKIFLERFIPENNSPFHIFRHDFRDDKIKMSVNYPKNLNTIPEVELLCKNNRETLNLSKKEDQKNYILRVYSGNFEMKKHSIIGDTEFDNKSIAFEEIEKLYRRLKDYIDKGFNYSKRKISKVLNYQIEELNFSDFNPEN